MCGIVTYVGPRPAAPILLDGLHRLEYRGYDSSGVAILNGGLHVAKAVGKVAFLEQRIQPMDLSGWVGIAHTRWATHGTPTEANAHPHTDCENRLALVHNGIIENHYDLREELGARGHVFRSETDTEVLCHLIEECYDGDLFAAVRKALVRVEGTFGLAVIHEAEPGHVVAARRGSPLILGVGENEMLVASDVAALVRHTKQVVYLQDDEVVSCRQDRYDIKTLDSRPVRHPVETVDWDYEAAEKGGYDHFMLKEIHEGPEAVRNAIRGRIVLAEGLPKLGGLESVMRRLERIRRLLIVSCGTSYYAGMAGRYMIEELSDVACEVDLASEFRYRKVAFHRDTAVLAISQSGETADTLAAVKEAKRRGALVLGLVNVVGSSIARETHAGVYNHAGPEIGVASTKAFVSQLSVLALISILLGRHRRLNVEDGRRLLGALQRIPDAMERIIERAPEVERTAQAVADCSHFLFVGRRFSYPVALEGALKLKEISYLHAEGYAAGEMKHGPIALVDRSYTAVCIAPEDPLYEKTISNIHELRSRGAHIVAVASDGDGRVGEFADHVLYIPRIEPMLTPILSVVPLQLLAYYIARANGREIDKPRNLAKSVTVE